MPNKNTIVQKGNREAQQIEVQLTAITPKPGTVVELTSAETYQLWDGAADGEMDEIVLLVEDANIGGLPEDAYTSGAIATAYIPLPGDEVLILVASGQTVVIGGKVIIDKGTGKFNATTGTPEMECFKMLEGSGGALAADTLLLARRI